MPSVQYIDYVHWQRQWLAGERQAAQLAYWRTRLSGLPPLLELPTDRPRPAVQRYVGGRVAVEVPQAHLPAIRALGHAEQASMFMVLLAVFQCVLSRYSGQSDIAVGSPVANRPRAELDGLVGFFANTLVLRSEVQARRSFRELLRAVRETTLSAHEHQDVPFEQLVEALQPERSLSHSPLFQVMFNLQHGGASTFALPGVTSTVLELPAAPAKFDLTLTLRERGGRLDGELEYSADLFDASSMRRLWRHYLVLLSAVLEAPDRALGRIELLTGPELAQLAAWNATEVAYPEDSVHALFERQAALTPESVAVVCDGAELRYAELEARANRLAHALRAAGVGPESTVGVCLPRTPELVVALLAILKAGGAYVPLDPEYPAARLAHILANAAPRVVLCDTGTRECVAGLGPEGSEVWMLDERNDALAAMPVDAPPALDSAAHLAYVIYTSGSTGLPKGVAITHGNAVAMLAWARRVFEPQALRNTLACTSICFDLSVYELFLPLATGNTVVLVRDALALVEQPPRVPVTLVNTVPSAIDAVLAAGALPASVRVVNLAGEALARGLVDRLYRQGHVEAVYNLYGPSEDTTYSTGCRVEEIGSDAPSIGVPIDNTRAYVLDAQMLPVPPGARGELYLAGAGVSRGYLGRPDLTAERYVPDPFGSGGRLYRTGDIVRHLPDGRLAYLGRADHQVKLRGFRIELGEIERAISVCAGVREAIAMVRRRDDGRDLLVAYVHLAHDAQQSEATLRTALAQQLPEYMIPARLLLLEALPLTANGKVDRRALSQWPLEDADSDAFEPPATRTEERLAELWCAILGTRRVGRHDSFFSAGGHSLLATALNVRIAEVFGVRSTLRDVFLHPRLADLADHIDNLQWMAGGADGARDETADDDSEVGVL